VQSIHRGYTRGRGDRSWRALPRLAQRERRSGAVGPCIGDATRGGFLVVARLKARRGSRLGRSKALSSGMPCPIITAGANGDSANVIRKAARKRGRRERNIWRRSRNAGKRSSWRASPDVSG
jgi:hypothetical protein